MAGARLLEVREGPGRLYEAVLGIEYRGRSYCITLHRLLRRPARLRVGEEGDYIVVELFDEAGGALATCCIHRGHLEKGCVECPSLLEPPSQRGRRSGAS